MTRWKCFDGSFTRQNFFSFVSAIHSAKTSNGEGENENKLVLNNDYNKHMGGVDKNDALTGNCSSRRKTLKWTTKIAVHMMEEANLNAFILYNKSGRGMHLLKFKLEFIRSILISKRDNDALVVSTNSIHFLELIPSTSCKSNPQGRCVVCYE